MDPRTVQREHLEPQAMRDRHSAGSVAGGPGAMVGRQGMPQEPGTTPMQAKPQSTNKGMKQINFNNFNPVKGVLEGVEEVLEFAWLGLKRGIIVTGPFKAIGYFTALSIAVPVATGSLWFIGGVLSGTFSNTPLPTNAPLAAQVGNYATRGVIKPVVGGGIQLVGASADVIVRQQYQPVSTVPSQQVPLSTASFGAPMYNSQGNVEKTATTIWNSQQVQRVLNEQPQRR